MIYYPQATGSIEEDTRAIQGCLDQAAADGGGTVWLSAGTAYHSKSLTLRGHVTLHLENGARLVASGDINDYRAEGGIDTDETRGVGTPVLRKPAFAFLYAYDAPSLAISGEGRIEGNCFQFVHRVNQYYHAGSFYPRPTLIYLERCDNLVVRDVTLDDSPFWSLHVAGSDNVLISAITIANPLDVANSDGIDIDHSTNVRIIGCHVRCADDGICLKNTAGNRGYPPTAQVLISDCTVISTSAALKIGTEGVDDFTDILVQNCIISASNRGISIQIRDGGSVTNARFSNILIRTRLFSADYWGKGEAIAITSFDRDHKTESGKISRIRFASIATEGEGGVLIAGDEGKISDIRFEDTEVRLTKTSSWPVVGYDLRPRERKPDLLERPVSAFYLSNATDIRFSDVRASIEAHEGFSTTLLESESASWSGEVEPLN